MCFNFFVILCIKGVNMKKNFFIKVKNYSIELITNGVEDFENIVLCFHGFNGDKWGDAFSGLKSRLHNSLLVSFDSCGHGESKVLSEEMRLSLILEEIDAVVHFFNLNCPNKPIIFVGMSYGAYRVIQYLIKYHPDIQKVIYINPAFNILETLEKTKGFKYSELKDGDKVTMKKSSNKFMKKEFLDDLFENNLYLNEFNISYDTYIIIGTRDSLISIDQTLDIANKLDCELVYIDEDHDIKNKNNWNIVVDIINGIK